jgi:hypothetical protein
MSGLSTARVRTWRRNTGALLAAALVVVQANCCDPGATCNMAFEDRAGALTILPAASGIDAETGGVTPAILPPCHRPALSKAASIAGVADSAASGFGDVLQARASGSAVPADCSNCVPRVAAARDSGVNASVAPRAPAPLKALAIRGDSPPRAIRPDGDPSAAKMRAAASRRAAPRVPLYIKHLALRN